MSALVADRSKRWPGRVPYKVDDVGEMSGFWLRTKIYEFNAACRHDVFVPWDGEANFVVFKAGGNSKLGMQGGPQDCLVRTKNLYHEMGHALGLGHTYYTSNCRIASLFEKMDKFGYDSNLADYVSFGNYQPSMMAYEPTSFSTSPRIKKVMELCEAQRSKLDEVVRIATAARLEVQTSPPPPLTIPNVPATQPERPTLVRKNSGGLPSTPLARTDRVAFDATIKPVRKKRSKIPKEYQGLSARDLSGLIDDARLIKEYWNVEGAFMLTVYPTDREAIAEVIGLTTARNIPSRLS